MPNKNPMLQQNVCNSQTKEHEWQHMSHSINITISNQTRTGELDDFLFLTFCITKMTIQAIQMYSDATNKMVCFFTLQSCWLPNRESLVPVPSPFVHLQF